MTFGLPLWGGQNRKNHYCKQSHCAVDSPFQGLILVCISKGTAPFPLRCIHFSHIGRHGRISRPPVPATKCTYFYCLKPCRHLLYLIYRYPSLFPHFQHSREHLWRVRFFGGIDSLLDHHNCPPFVQIHLDCIDK